MRKIAIGTALGVLLLAGCGGGSSTASTTETTDADAAQTAAAATQAPAADQKYGVTIDESWQTSDYQGAPVLVVSYGFTNNSDKATSFMIATHDQAFQDGVELSSAILIGEPGYDSEASMKEIKPGATIQVQKAYVLDSTSDVEIEVTELISFNDTPLAVATISVG